jgi:hypothetical protein
MAQKAIIDSNAISPMIRMEEITVKVPKGLPGPYLKKKIEDLVREEELKWALFERCKEELSLSKEDLEELERAREMAWCETKKKYGDYFILERF